MHTVQFDNLSRFFGDRRNLFGTVLVSGLTALTQGQPDTAAKKKKKKKQQHAKDDEIFEEGVQSEIVGGAPVDWGADVEFMVSVQIRGGADKDGRKRHICGGSLVSLDGGPQATRIVTAAHCLHKLGKYRRPKRVRILTGTNRLGNEKRHTFRVSDVRIHPQFNPNSAAHDVATIDLAIPMDPAIAKPIALPTEEDAILYLPGTEGTTCGWGDTRQHRVGQKKYRFSPSAVLKCVSLYIRDDETCDKANGTPLDFTQSFCASDHREDSCQGDSGGPFIGWRTDGVKVLLGIVSGGPGCASPRRPGFYAEVRGNIDFIKGFAVA